jgi:hypothetical protein
VQNTLPFIRDDLKQTTRQCVPCSQADYEPDGERTVLSFGDRLVFNFVHMLVRQIDGKLKAATVNGTCFQLEVLIEATNG